MNREERNIQDPKTVNARHKSRGSKDVVAPNAQRAVACTSGGIRASFRSPASGAANDINPLSLSQERLAGTYVGRIGVEVTDKESGASGNGKMLSLHTLNDSASGGRAGSVFVASHVAMLQTVSAKYCE